MAGITFEHGTTSSREANLAFKKQLNKVYGWYTGGFILFVVLLVVLRWRRKEKEMRFEVWVVHGLDPHGAFPSPRSSLSARATSEPNPSA